MKKLITGGIILALATSGVASCGETEVLDRTETVATTTVTTTEQSEEERKEDLRQKLDSVVPVNQVDEGNLRDACIMAIHEEIPNAGDYDFPTPIDLGDPDSAGIYSAGGDFRYELADGLWDDAAYFCIIYTNNGVITDSSAVVTG